VSAETSFVSQIAKIKRRVAVKAACDLLLNAGLIFLGLLLFLFIAAIWGLADAGANGPWYMVSGGISLSAAGFIVFLTRRNFLQVLIEIDRRLGLQDRLSTAYEFFKLKNGSEFSELLIQDAAACLRRLDRRQLLPGGFSRRHLIFIILLPAVTALYTLDYQALLFESAHVGPKTTAHADALLRNYSFRRIEDKPRSPTGPPAALSSKLEQLGKQLNDPSRTSDQRLNALTAALKDLQAERSRLADELAAKLNAAGIQGVSVRQIPRLEDLSPDHAAKIKELLNKALTGPARDAANEDLESLEQLESIEKILSQLADEARKDQSESQNFAASADDEIQPSQDAGELGYNRDDPRQSMPDKRLNGSDRSSPGRTGAQGSGRTPENEDGLRDEEGLGEGISSSAGRAESAGEKKSSADIEKSSGPTMPDKLAASPVKSYLIPIRALTDVGKARLKEEDIRRTYGKAVESVLQKEDIPLNYREYIKNYFMAIGLNPKE